MMRLENKFKLKQNKMVEERNINRE